MIASPLAADPIRQIAGRLLAASATARTFRNIRR
jgi:hypothetical protein